MTETKKLWTEEDELAYQAGDMNGILYQDENRDTLTTGKQQVKVNIPVEDISDKKPLTGEKASKSMQKTKNLGKVDSNDKPDIKITDTPFWMNIKR